MFWEFFRFELRLRRKSISTYIYFFVWFAFAFLCVASENFGPVAFSNGKVLLNGPYAASFNAIGVSLFGVIIVAAIFGTSILRDFQRDTFQILFTKPISKFAYLGGRWAGSFVTCILAFSGCILGEWLGTFAPWADHSRIGPNHFWWDLQPFLSITVVQIFVLGSLFFCVAALSRKIFVVYVQGAALFILYLIGITAFSATRSLERFWSGILDPIGFILIDDITRYWTVVEKNTLLLSWSPSVGGGVFLYNRLLWLGVGFASLAVTWALFPMSAEALTASSQGRRAAKAKQQEDFELAPARSIVAARLPRVNQVFSGATTWAQFTSLSRLRISTILHEVPFWAIVGLMIGFAVNNGYFAGRVAEINVWPVTYLMVQAVEGGATLFFFIVAGLYAAELMGWKEKWLPRGMNLSGNIARGLGLSLHTWGGRGHASDCDLSIHPDGSVDIKMGTQDIGTGTRTCIAVVAADALGLRAEDIKLYIGDTLYPPSGGSGGSTTPGGVSSSTRRAVVDARDALFARVAPALAAQPEELEAREGTVRVKGDPKRSLSWKEACSKMGATPITAHGHNDSVAAKNKPDLTNSGVGGVQMAEVAVDIETGIVKVTKMVAVQDCGLIIDLRLAESSVMGAMIMGISYSLFEEKVMDPTTGVMLNADMEFYRLAGLNDIPEMKVHMMTGKGYDERGVIGLGEPPAVSPGAAISNAVANAIGVRVGVLPITPDKVLAAMGSAQKAGA